MGWEDAEVEATGDTSSPAWVGGPALTVTDEQRDGAAGVAGSPGLCVSGPGGRWTQAEAGVGARVPAGALKGLVPSPCKTALSVGLTRWSGPPAPRACPADKREEMEGRWPRGMARPSCFLSVALCPICTMTAQAWAPHPGGRWALPSVWSWSGCIPQSPAPLGKDSCPGCPWGN